MHWLEAVYQSEKRVARRYDREGNLYLRQSDGSTLKFLPNRVEPVKARAEATEGYLDWEPLK